MLRNKIFRWALLGLGLLAIIALTGMNVYSLYDIRDRMVDGDEKLQLKILDDLVRDISGTLYEPFDGLGSLELEPTENTIVNYGKFPPLVHDKIIVASESPLFDGIYYTPEGTDPCLENSKVYSFNYSTQRMDYTNDYPSTLCDGVGLARTKAKIELNSFNYRWNTNTEFDAHRTMNIGFININENRIIGYLSASLNKDFIINDLIAPKFIEYFDPKVYPQTILWLHDWANNDILATNNPSVNYDRELEDARRKFLYGNMLDNWRVKIAFLGNPVGAVYNSTLIKNLIVLGFAMLFLMGALLFMFYTAQKERNLSQRQAGFLANVTHELKTPLAVMQAAGENISDGRVTEPERLKQYGEHIYDESIRLRKMIERLLDVAKTDSGQTLIKAAPTNLNNTVQQFVKENRVYLESKGFTPTFKPSLDKSLIMIDNDHLETVLSNLTENAIKYSSKKKSLKFSVESDFKNMILHVSDTGIGIRRKHLKNIFKKFYRVEDSLNAKTKGHGLGLSIVKNLIELNAGNIEVSSEFGKGTTFTISFPIFVREENKITPEKGSKTKTKNVINTSEYA